jgi:hypothetical protein
MATKTDRRPKSRAGNPPPKRRPKSRAADPPPKRGTEPSEQLPTWRNTRPRGNPEPDRQDLERSRERFEALLGR